MTTKNNPDPDTLTALQSVVQNLDAGGRLISHRKLLGGISASMVAFEMLDGVGKRRKLVLRKPGARVLAENPCIVDYEFRVLTLLDNSRVPAPLPVYIDESGRIFREPYMVVEYLEGAPLYHAGDSSLEVEAFVAKMARALADLHSLKLSEEQKSFLTNQKERLLKKFSKRPDKLDYSIREPEIRDILERQMPLACHNDAVLLHGDFWPGNILWQEGEITGIIDWEDGELGDPLYEIAVTRFDILWIFGREAMEHFTGVYRACRNIDFTALPYYELMAAIRPALRVSEWVEGWTDLGRGDVTEETFMDCHKYYVDRALREIS